MWRMKMLLLACIFILLPGCFSYRKDPVDVYRSAIAKCMKKGLTPCKFDLGKGTPHIKCIRRNQLCDGDRDCPHGDDEMGCQVSVITDKTSYCGAGQVKCANGKCARVCDGWSECQYGEDEMSCTICEEGEVACKKHNGWQGCAKLCDGVSECDKNLDEAKCVSTKCRKGEIICRDGNCATLCNNCTDCRNHEDELDCFSKDMVAQQNICPFGSIGCSNNVTYDLCEFGDTVAAEFGVENFVLRSQCLQFMRQICPILNFVLYAGPFT